MQDAFVIEVAGANQYDGLGSFARSGYLSLTVVNDTANVLTGGFSCQRLPMSTVLSRSRRLFLNHKATRFLLQGSGLSVHLRGAVPSLRSRADSGSLLTHPSASAARDSAISSCSQLRSARIGPQSANSGG